MIQFCFLFSLRILVAQVHPFLSVMFLFGGIFIGISTPIDAEEGERKGRNHFLLFGLESSLALKFVAPRLAAYQTLLN